MDQETRTLLTGSLRGAMESGDVLSALDDMGWDEVAAEYPTEATTLLFTEHGRTLAGSRVLDRTVLRRLGLPIAGHAIGYPVPPASERPTSSIDRVEVLVLGALDDVARVVVPLHDGGYAVLEPTGATTEPVTGFAAGIGWLRVNGRGSRLVGVPSAEWPDVVASARCALAAEIIGVSETALRLAVEHTGARVQFGRPIASFQAVRHRLAEAHVAVTSAATVLDTALAVGGRWQALVAKATAGRAHDTVSAHVLQVCGAIGLTDEHPLHRYVTRGAVLDALLGGFRQLEPELGRHLLATGEFPTLAEV